MRRAWGFGWSRDVVELMRRCVCLGCGQGVMVVTTENRAEGLYDSPSGYGSGAMTWRLCTTIYTDAAMRRRERFSVRNKPSCRVRSKGCTRFGCAVDSSRRKLSVVVIKAACQHSCMCVVGVFSAFEP